MDSMSSGSRPVTEVLQSNSRMSLVICLSLRRDSMNSSRLSFAPGCRICFRALTLAVHSSAEASRRSRNWSSLPKNFCSENIIRDYLRYREEKSMKKCYGKVTQRLYLLAIKLRGGMKRDVKLYHKLPPHSLVTRL